MQLFSTPKRHCPERDCKVSTNQSETECRAQHGCGQPHCPLKYDFKSDPIDVVIQASRIKQ